MPLRTLCRRRLIARVARGFLYLLLMVSMSLHSPRVAYADHETYVHENYPHESYDDDSIVGELILYIFAGIAAGIGATAPWWGPTAVIGDDHISKGYFPAHPYPEDEGGYMRMEEDISIPKGPWAVRILAEYGNDFDAIDRIGGSFHFETTRRWGFDAQWSHYEDRLARIEIDDVWVGDFNLIYRFAQSEHAQWWTGAGFNWLDDATETDWGYNLTYGADIYLGKPWILSGELDYGKQGDEDFFHGRVTLGAQWRHIETFAGYDYLNAGPTEVGTFLIGLRAWF